MFGRRAVTYDGVTYVPGARYQVIVPGLSLVGWVPVRHGHQGWRHDLEVGDVIECTGWGPGMGSDPGYGVEFTIPGAAHVAIRPGMGSIWDYRPPADSLQPTNDPLTNIIALQVT